MPAQGCRGDGAVAAWRLTGLGHHQWSGLVVGTPWWWRPYRGVLSEQRLAAAGGVACVGGAGVGAEAAVGGVAAGVVLDVDGVAAGVAGEGVGAVGVDEGVVAVLAVDVVVAGSAVDGVVAVVEGQQ